LRIAGSRGLSEHIIFVINLDLLDILKLRLLSDRIKGKCKTSYQWTFICRLSCNSCKRQQIL